MIQALGTGLAALASPVAAVMSVRAVRHARDAKATLAVVQQQTNGMLHGLAAQHTDALAILAQAKVKL